MFAYIARRVMLMIPMLFLISVVSFTAMHLPPGDYLTSVAAQLREQGEAANEDAINALRARYGLGEPIYVQYAKWVTGIVTRGDWGQSLEWQKPVSQLIWDRMALTVGLAVFSLMVSWLIAIPIGVYTSTHQYSLPDYALSMFSFFGVGVPAFLWALIIMYIAQAWLGFNVGGLFSEQFINAPWSWDKVADFLRHIWIPCLIIILVYTADEIRITRANMLDELNKPYVELARAKGLPEGRLIWKYPVRVALNPFFSTVGWSLASRIGDITLLSVVLNLDTTGPMQLRALVSLDMYLAGGILLLLSVLVVVGTLVSDVLLAWADPRIRLEG